MSQKGKNQQVLKTQSIDTDLYDSTGENPLEKEDTEKTRSIAKKHSKKKKRARVELSDKKDEIERKLEALIENVSSNFGDASESITKPIFVIDTSASMPTASISEPETKDEAEDPTESAHPSEGNSGLFGPVSAWHDSDDEKVYVSLKSKNMLKKLRKTEEENVIPGDQYEMRLRHQFEKIYPVPKWATKSQKRKRKQESDSDDSTGEESSGEEASGGKHDGGGQDSMQIIEIPKVARSKLLPVDKLEISKVKDANLQAYSQCVVQVATFHPNARVIMTAGLDKTIRLFQVDGKINPKIQSVVLKDLPIYRASFNSSGTEIIATGRKKHFYIFDIEAGSIDRSSGITGFDYKSLENFSISPCGKYICFLGSNGNMILVSYHTKQFVASMKMNGTVNSAHWSSDGKYLFSIGKDAEVYQWDVGARRCVHKFQDHGGFRPSIISVAKDNRYFAIGSNSGIVNVYDDTCLNMVDPKPLKSIMNLTTNIHDMKFNHDTQLLGISSHSKKGQLRMIHLPSLTTFQNWPNVSTPLRYVQCFDFSPSSGYLAIGNDKGKVLLYRLGHYGVA
ncbi:3850_t:CDS:2 [Acaulospora morrowiae]|uniref:U3 small nucleolar RNA-associated protein 18 homolog n=1 Tax=Acaulospora morrowiae TaxID=94023 RepID=A0A9N8V8J1_9GLOM|nr:3850_t:CDS:2 [Acaulospora morrowiae]